MIIPKGFYSVPQTLEGGYRHADTKELVITTNYATTIQRLNFKPPVPYDIVIPIAEIETARFHDETLFRGFQSSEQEQPLDED